MTMKDVLNDVIRTGTGVGAAETIENLRGRLTVLSEENKTLKRRVHDLEEELQKKSSEEEDFFVDMKKGL